MPLETSVNEHKNCERTVDHNSFQEQYSENNTSEQFIYEQAPYVHRGMIHKKPSSDSDSKSNHSILWQFLKQLSPQTDLLKMCSPVFLLRPISTLELFTYYCEPTAGLKVLSFLDKKLDRMLMCLMFALGSCSNTRGDSFEGIKPYNPILGEIFKAKWKPLNPFEHDLATDSCSKPSQTLPWFSKWLSSQSNSHNFSTLHHCLFQSNTSVLAEQISHHPPVSAFYMENSEANFKMESTFQIVVKFRGNSVATCIAGSHVLNVKCGVQKDLEEEYSFVLPNMVVNGLFFGSSHVSNGDVLKISCPQSGLEANISFSGQNDIKGELVQCKNQKLFTFKGNVGGKIFMTPCQPFDMLCEQSELLPFIHDASTELNADFKYSSKKTNNHRWLFYQASLTNAIPEFSNKLCVKPLHEQAENESRKVWHPLTYALQMGDLDGAYQEKHQIEQVQREKRMEENQAFEPKYFRLKEKTVKVSDQLQIPLYEHK
ncbi:hypothetical protein C9374_012111 [Naegleria lovaniensis]|uniref:Oxysterol-binding protein n=1 Tax=Naegleria lovaniensis TaxID=51637 RepID=A0AA88KE67_NAELO|nr:uncharacterized protein C9374_012111 [Naegleria lovaniensis]KAG2373504.1 hypothetical protein C9374_012111 [Naegleria lovaniensis]